jgi:hypothetical protein
MVGKARKRDARGKRSRIVSAGLAQSVPDPRTGGCQRPDALWARDPCGVRSGRDPCGSKSKGSSAAGNSGLQADARGKRSHGIVALPATTGREAIMIVKNILASKRGEVVTLFAIVPLDFEKAGNLSRTIPRPASWRPSPLPSQQAHGGIRPASLCGIRGDSVANRRKSRPRAWNWYTARG